MKEIVTIFIGAWNYGLAHGSEFIQALQEHIILVSIAMTVAIVVCVPLGIWTSRSRLVSLAAMNTINTLRVIPSLAVLFLIIPYFGLSATSAAVALILLAMPPILINTDAAFRHLPVSVLEAARGMGMKKNQILWRIEFPLAMPVILTGLRISAVEVIASATLAAFVGSGGLGIYITRGFALYDYSILFVGAVPVALLTLMSESLLGGLQRIIAYPR